jgi:hypothetical protein
MFATLSLPNMEAGNTYSTVPMGTASKSRLEDPTLIASNQRPKTSTARLAFQSLEMTYETEGMTNNAEDESCGSRTLAVTRSGRPANRRRPGEIAEGRGLERWCSSVIELFRIRIVTERSQ